MSREGQDDATSPAGRSHEQPLVIAGMLQSLARSRRFHLEEYIEGDGPYWTIVGLFLDEGDGVATTIDRMVVFTDESLEASRFILRHLIDLGFVQRDATSDRPTYRLTPSFRLRFARYLNDQVPLVHQTCARLGSPGAQAADGE